MISPAADPVGANIVESLAEIGYDYIELSMCGIAALPEPEFAGVAARLRRSGIRCEALNCFFPASVRLTGESARLDQALEYAAGAMDRAAALGADIIVFGSSGAKNVPAGFSMEAAWRQIVDLLRRLGPMAADRGLTIAIEPLNRGESNIVNLASEGLKLAREVDHPAVRLLIDYYHLAIEKEDPGIAVQAGPALRHVHFAKVEGRSFPDRTEEDYRRFFSCLRRAAYSRRCSIESVTADFEADARRALPILRQLASAGE
ncbi:MAG: sugar phosphate isomerase/epimerase family protein [Opitutaceae bacterium]|jgi:sugar phosphate isomerase/epimerase